MPADPTEAGPLRKEDRDSRRLAMWLDDVLQVIAEGTRGGGRRQPTSLEDTDWDVLMERLSNETEATVRMLKQKNARAAARAQQQAKRRGIVRAPKN